MKSFHDRHGFTLIELMVTVAIAGIVIAIAMPAMTSYKRKEDARGAAQNVGGVVTDARSQAIASGRMTFLLLGEPTNGLFPFEPGQVAALVKDEDGDNVVTESDSATPIYLPSGLNPDVTLYGAKGTPLEGFAIPADDLSQFEADASLGSLTDGSTLPVSADLGVSVVAFSPQGAPVAPDTPAEWGTGAGGIYLTDNQDMVLGVLVMPLGSVKVQKLDLSSGEWR